MINQGYSVRRGLNCDIFIPIEFYIFRSTNRGHAFVIIYIQICSLWKESLNIDGQQIHLHIYKQKRTTKSHLIPLNRKKTAYFVLEIHVLTSDRHSNVAELKWLIWSQFSPSDNWVSKDNTDIHILQFYQSNENQWV